MESVGLVHTETQHIAKRLATRAIANGRNLLLDVTMGSESSVRSWLVNLRLAVYSVDVVIAAIDSEDAVGWAEEDHRQGHDQYARGARSRRPGDDPGRSAPPRREIGVGLDIQVGNRARSVRRQQFSTSVVFRV